MSNLSINNNLQTQNTYLKTKRNDEEQEKASKKIASGKRNEEAGNDAASLAISQELVSQIDGLDQASKNSQDGISLLQTADGGLSQVTDMVQRARELTLQASSSIYTDADKKLVNAELSQISEAVAGISKNTQFNEKALLNGDNPKITIQTGANDGEQLNLDLSNSDISGLNITKGGFDITGDTSEILKSLDADLESLSTARADIGSQENRLVSTINNNDNYSVNLSKANSSLSDTDIAEEASKINKSQIIRAAQMNIMMQENTQKDRLLNILA